MTAAAPTKRKYRWGQALFWASLAAWLVYTAFALLAALFETYIQPAAHTDIVGFNLAVAIFGLPVAVAVCLPIGFIGLLVAEFMKLTKWWQAALVGALGSVVAAPIFAIASLARGLGSFRNLQLDGRLIIALAILAVAGACAGMTAWGSLWLDGKYSGSRANRAEH